MRDAVKTLTETLTRPLWREDPAYRTGRRLRQLVLTPVMVLAGIIWGVLASPAAGETLGWAAGGAFAFSFALYLHLHLQPVVIGFGEWAFRGASWLAALLWDWLVVGGVIYLLTDVLGMPTFSAVSGAVLVGGAYGLFVAAFFDVAGSRFLGGLFFGGWSRPRVSFSQIETMLVRGDSAAALEALREFVTLHPYDARGWITLGRLLRQDPGAAVEALSVLRSGLERGQLTVEQEQRYLHEIVGLCEASGAADLAVPDLERFVEARAGSIQARWAGLELERISGPVAGSR